MSGGKHNKGCCKTSCIIVQDSFNRAGSDLGSSWTHEVGDWITVPTGPWINGYAESQADGAIAIHNTPHPTPSETGVVYVDIINEVDASGDKYRAIVNAVDKDSYHFAEYIRNGADDSILRLGVSSGGSDTILESKVIVGLTDPSGEPRRLSVKISSNEFCAVITHAVLSKVWVDEAPIAGGYYAGFGGDEGTQFSHWTFAHHRETKAGCDVCLCNCETNYIPPRLFANIVGTGRMADIDCDLYLEWERVDETWRSTTELCCNHSWKLRLNCPEGPDQDVTTAKITVEVGCTNSLDDTGQPGHAQRYANAGSTCKPLNLVFGPFFVSTSDLDCGCKSLGPMFPYGDGEYYITIVEAP